MRSLKNELNRTQTILLSVIAICLMLITVKMYIPTAKAHPMGMVNGWNEDWGMKDESLLVIIERCSATGYKYKIECPVE